MSLFEMQKKLADRYEVYRNVDDALEVTFHFTDQSGGFSLGAFYNHSQTMPASETQAVRADRVLKYTGVEISYPIPFVASGDLSSQAATTLLELAGKAA